MATGKRVAMVLAKNFEDCEAIDPKAALEERGAREGEAYAVHAERLEGALFEVRASAL